MPADGTEGGEGRPGCGTSGCDSYGSGGAGTPGTGAGGSIAIFTYDGLLKVQACTIQTGSVGDGGHGGNGGGPSIGILYSAASALAESGNTFVIGSGGIGGTGGNPGGNGVAQAIRKE